MLAANATIADWLQLIKAEYREIPGLKLTTRQVQRLWGLDSVRCDSLLAALVDAKVLRRTVDHRYVRADVA
jgi:aryl carrier-like protein